MSQEQMTIREAWATRRGKAVIAGVGGALAFCALVVLAVALAPGDPEPPPTLATQLQDAGAGRVIDARCAAGDCEVTIDHRSTGVGSDRDLATLAARQAQGATWGIHPEARSVMVTVSGILETAGGKRSRGAQMAVTCDRAAAGQIDWENVSARGVRSLCRVAELARFDD